MGTQLSIDQTEFVILTFNGSRHFISKERERELQRAGEKDFFKVDNGMIKISSIVEVLLYEKWKETEDYQKYLNNQPEERRIFEDSPKIVRTKESHDKAMRKMKEGFENYFREQKREIPKDLKERIYKKMLRYC